MRGLWQEAPGANGPLQLGLVEFVPCGDRTCGLKVVEGLACGPRIMEFDAAVAGSNPDQPRFKGTMALGSISMEVFGSMKDGGLQLNAVQLGRPSASRRALPVFSGRFIRVGEGGCAGPVS